MPRKLLPAELVSSVVLERLVIWGHTIRTQRVRQRVTADQLCSRIGVSRATLSRIERGDPAVSVAGYMSIFDALGILDEVMPSPPALLWSAGEKGRVKERHAEADGDYF